MRLAVLAGLVALAFLPTPAEALVAAEAVVAAGVCPLPYAGPVVLVGARAVTGLWTLELQTGACGGGVVHATGAWNPSTGGCVQGSLGSLCVSAIPNRAAPTPVTIDFCNPPDLPFVGGACTYGAPATAVRV